MEELRESVLRSASSNVRSETVEIWKNQRHERRQRDLRFDSDTLDKIVQTKPDAHHDAKRNWYGFNVDLPDQANLAWSSLRTILHPDESDVVRDWTSEMQTKSKAGKILRPDATLFLLSFYSDPNELDPWKGDLLRESVGQVNVIHSVTLRFGPYHTRISECTYVRHIFHPHLSDEEIATAKYGDRSKLMRF